MGVDVRGWLASDVVRTTWIKVWKRESAKLFLMKGDVVERTFRVALGSQNPVGQKVKRGDGATPEGRFFVAELDDSPESGPLWRPNPLRLSYPSVDDARRGLHDHLIDKSTTSVSCAPCAPARCHRSTRRWAAPSESNGVRRYDWTLGSAIALDDEECDRAFRTCW